MEVTDDSGFLALVAVGAYRSFVARKWTLDQIHAHFKAQMAAKSLLIWGTGCEGTWRVDVLLGKTPVTGFREVCGPIAVVAPGLLVTNYESLTMAAQYEDVILPERHQQGLLLNVPAGEYACRILQLFDPERGSGPERSADFVVELQPANEPLGVWPHIPWADI